MGSRHPKHGMTLIYLASSQEVKLIFTFILVILATQSHHILIMVKPHIYMIVNSYLASPISKRLILLLF